MKEKEIQYQQVCNEVKNLRNHINTLNNNKIEYENKLQVFNNNHTALPLDKSTLSSSSDEEEFVFNLLHM